MRRWRTSSKTGNKKERKLVLANDNPQQGERQGGLPHFFVVGRLSASFSSGRWWSRKSSLETKVPLRGSVSHTKRRWGCEFFIFLKYPPYVQEKGCAVSLTEMGLFSPVFSAFGSHKNCMRNQMFYWTPSTYSIKSPGWHSKREQIVSRVFHDTNSPWRSCWR